jgi:RNA polymerase sigma factor (sigma-70 family)
VRDREWLTRLYEEHSDAVFRYAARRLTNREDAEDVLVEVYTVAWRRRTVVPEQALPWLYRTAANTIAHVVRGDARRGRLHARLTAVTPLYSEDHLPDPDLGAALQRLAPADAEILRLWAWEGLEAQEIAAVLDISPGAARTRLSRAKARLREHYESGEEVGS